MMDLFIGLVTGALFGAALYCAGVACPAKMRKTLRLEDNEIFKIMLFALGLSSALLYVFNLVGILEWSHLSVKTMHLGVIVGGLIFGVGFGMVGSCPGTAAAALGTNIYKQAIVIILGGIAGALAFSLMYGSIANTGIFDMLNYGKLTLFYISYDFPSILDISYVGLLVMGLSLMAAGWFIPCKKEV